MELHHTYYPITSTLIQGIVDHGSVEELSFNGAEADGHLSSIKEYFVVVP